MDLICNKVEWNKFCTGTKISRLSEGDTHAKHA